MPAALLLAQAGPTRAAFGICGSDPIVSVDKQKVHITVSINAPVASVDQVVYTVHVPANTDKTKVKFIKDPNNLYLKETVNIVADGPDGTFESDTVVTSADGSAFPVSVVTSLGTQSSRAGGASGQVLTGWVTLAASADGKGSKSDG